MNKGNFKIIERRLDSEELKRLENRGLVMIARFRYKKQPYELWGHLRKAVE